jgi:hypothetical protein
MATTNSEKITYNIAIFSASENRKTDVKKRSGKNTFMKLDSDESFDTWKAQLLVRIDSLMKPDHLDIDYYEVSFAIPRISPSPINVTSNNDYTMLIERSLKNKEKSANIYIQEKAVTKVLFS